MWASGNLLPRGEQNGVHHTTICLLPQQQSATWGMADFRLQCTFLCGSDIMNPHLKQLQAYPFARLRQALADIQPPAGVVPVPLHIGEPKHPTPDFIKRELADHLDTLAAYPQTAGTAELRRACADFVQRRYGLTLDPEREILPTLGSREALFSFVQTVIDGEKRPRDVVLAPNPFYQIYEGAALLAGAEIHFANCRAPDFLPDWDSVAADIWPRVRVVFVCSPDNPSGSVMQLADWQKLFALQDQYGFIIAADECYSEIYFENQAPSGCLKAAADSGRSFDKLISFTSLSKRSNVPGLRSGFVSGDAALLADFLLYRTYHGSAMSLPIQKASAAAWADEAHAEANRRLYREKFDHVLPILQVAFEVQRPDASFYIWLKIPDGDDLAFTRRLWQKAAIQVLPGRFLARDTAHGNPGQGYVRIALVAPLEDCVAAAHTIVRLQQETDHAPS